MYTHANVCLYLFICTCTHAKLYTSHGSAFEGQGAVPLELTWQNSLEWLLASEPRLPVNHSREFDRT